MSKSDIAKQFAESFHQASGSISAATYSSCIRFIAIALVILATMWAVNHFMDKEERSDNAFLIHLGSRLIRIVLGLCLFILILIVKGS